MWNKNFAYLVSGRIFTNIGDSLYAVASMWLIYDLTQNSFYTGLGGFLTMAPLILQFFIGPLIKQERYKSILIYTQMIQAILLLVIPLAHFLGVLSVWLVLIINPIASIIQQFVYPTHAAILPTIVEEKYLTKANSIMNATYQLLDVILLGISGTIIALIGTVFVYMLGSVTFFIAMLLFFYIKIPKTDLEEKDFERDFSLKDKWENYKADLKKGYQFIKGSLIPKFLLASILANFIIGAVSAILPEYAVYRGGSDIYGWYLAAMSFGLLMGSTISSFFSQFPLGKVTIIGFFCSGLSWFLAGITNIHSLSVILFGGSYVAIGITNVLFLSSLQKIVPSDLLGRVFSFIVGAISIAAPLGSLTGGTMAPFIGSWIIFIFGSIAMVFVSIYWLVIPTLRNLPITDALEYRHLFSD
ncbi:MFS transporter [Caldibacillus debilis]|uniref:Transmembrane secretion effector n=1 Tax=Caldibacillus debilis GB1 TaxID=1339248 RepID=A0A420VEC8_9BACI|nr:MFS transporter [Caldibacillus debilis]RKO61895.1 Transmembrane secretion effector [Caldibacillus debilis GB1]